MSARDPPLLLVSEPEEDPIPVSPRKLAQLLRDMEELKETVRTLREESTCLREERSRSREKESALKAALDRLRTSLSILGTDAKTAASVGVPSSRVFFRQSLPPDRKRRPTGGQPGHPGTTRPRPTPNVPPRVLDLKECPKCAHDLGAPADSWRRPATDLPAPGLEIFDLVVLRYKVPRVRGTGPRADPRGVPRRVRSSPEGVRGRTPGARDA